MLAELLADVLGVRLFGYISFRVAMAAMFAFAFALLAGGPTIRWLRRHRVGEPAHKTDSAELAAHAATSGKNDTPTMGGSFLVASLLASVLLWARLDNVNVVLAVILTAGIAAVGFVDDFKKLSIPGSKGLSARAKMVGLTAVTLGVLLAVVYFARTSGRPTLLALHPPFFKDAVLRLGEWGIVGVALFLAFEWLVVVGTSNAANVTDGLDGLAAGCMIIAGLALSIFCYVTGRFDWSGYLNIPYVRHASEMAVVGGALCGACMGFLWFNAFPAKVFMGDSGSLPIGALLGWMALVSKQELVLPLIACVFFLDLGSSFLQTAWFRRSGGRRLFTCAPVHHGYQLFGGALRRRDARWHEVTVVIRFWIVAAVGAMTGLALLKVR